jgi:hypothetical protein
LQCEYICQKIQKLISQHQQNNQDLSGSLLVIDIITPIDGGDSHIPKIEYKPDSLA